MKTLVTIETGGGSCECHAHVGEYAFIVGTGRNVEEAKKDFLRAYKELIDANREDKVELPDSVLNAEFEYIHSPQSVLCEFDLWKISKLAQYLGVNARDLQNYRLNRVYVGEKWDDKVLKGLNTLGHRLCEMTEPKGE